MARRATGIDIGSSTARLIEGEVKGTTFVVSAFEIAENPGGSLAAGWAALGPQGKLAPARVGVSGSAVNMRYTRVPRLPDWQLRKLMRFETEEIGGQSESRVASDFNVLPEIPEIEGEDVVLLALAREAMLDEHLAGLAGLGGKLDAFTPNAVALYNAFLHYGVVLDDTVLVANLGKESLDVILVRGTDLLFARNLSGGAKLFDEAIAQRFGVDVARAERYKIDEGRLDSGVGFQDANQEKAARAMTGPAGQILSLLQSAVVFAKSQVKLSTLKLDRVFLCGGGAALEGLTEYLQKGLSVPVELFDPFRVVDTSKLDAQTAELLEDNRLEAVIALGLATSASDPEAYAIEILPESMRKRREFLQGPAFLLAAAVLAMAFLGAKTWHERARLTELQAKERELSTRYQRAARNDRQTRALLEDNERLAGYAEELFALAGAGEELVRTLTIFEEKLPADFWVDTMSLTHGSDRELGVEPPEERPILHLKGRTREGTETPTLLFEEFVSQLRERMPSARFNERMGTTDFTLDLTTLAAIEADPSGAGDTEEEDAGE